MGALQGFEQINREYYPGSNRPIGTAPDRSVEEPDDERWDLKPRIYQVNGEDVEFFTVGQLGKALGGRKPVTMRKWERTGLIPKATFTKPSDDPRGKRRLYTRAQIEGMVQIATEEGMLNPFAKPIKDTNFKARVVALFKELAAQQ
jgi:hypothetical protein